MPRVACPSCSRFFRTQSGLQWHQGREHGRDGIGQKPLGERGFEPMENRTVDIPDETGATALGQRQPAPESANSVASLPPVFNVHDRVRLKATGRECIITGVLPNDQYQVFLSSAEQPILSAHDLEPLKTAFNFVNAQEFLRDLLLFKFRRPLSDTLYSYAASKTNFEVYQFKPVIKFVNNPGNRILIADEVGLGKTIEACLIYLELKARVQGNLPRVLVVCPAGLTRKWQDELYSRFGEQFSVLDGGLLDEFFRRWELDRSGATIRGICSIERLRGEHVSQRLVDLGIEFDLVIVDEAHHMRNPETLSFDLGEILSAHADAMILLTATPVQLRALDLFYLLNILDSGEFESPDLFEHQLEPNRYINRAIRAASQNPPNLIDALSELEAVPKHIKGNPYYVEAAGLLTESVAEQEEGSPRAHIEAIRSLHGLNTLSHVFNRSRRAEVGAGTTRVANVISVALSPIEREIYETAMEFARAKAEHTRGYAFALGLIQIERQVASSLGAYKIVVDDYVKGHETPIEIDQITDEMDIDPVIKIPAVYELAENLKSLYMKLGDQDSKFLKFKEEVDRLLQENRKVIVFSFFKRTLEYLRKRLTNVGLTVDVIHGDIRPLERQPILDRFRDDPDRQILLSSEVGAEGQDFQFCDAIINYDLPWNPMRVEQRIGRIDRYGQQSDKVTVASLFLEGTIEQRILMRLYERIGVFKDSIGELEPILGEIVKELSYEVITRQLTPQQESELLERHLTSLEHKKRDLLDFENNRFELMGHDDIFTNEVETSIANGRYVSANEIYALCSSYLATKFPRTRLESVRGSENHIWKFVPDATFRGELDRFLNRPESRRGAVDIEFSRKIHGVHTQGGPSGVPLTFDNALANQRRPLQFVNIWHPLTRMAHEFFDSLGHPPPEHRIVSARIFTKDRELAGDYTLFLFSIATHGVIPSHELIPILVSRHGGISESTSAIFLKALHDMPEFEEDYDQIWLSAEEFDRAKQLAYRYMGQIRTEREESSKQRNEALVAVRKSSLDRTFQAKTRRAQGRLATARDQRIIRMHQGEIRNLQTRLERAVGELEERRQVSVSYEPVAYGAIRLVELEEMESQIVQALPVDVE